VRTVIKSKHRHRIMVRFTFADAMRSGLIPRGVMASDASNVTIVVPP
jgi:hypothetical protein